MNTVLGIGALLLGGLVLPGADPSTGPESATPIAEGPSVPLDVQRTRAENGPAARGAPLNYGSSLSSRANRGVARQESFVPMAPTDPTLSAPDSPWAAPSESTSPSVAPGFGSRASASGVAPNRPRAAAAAPSGAPPVSRSYAQSLMQAQASHPMPGVTKPFNSYSAPSTVSPYMNLYRPGVAGADNYTTLVQPMLNQQSANQLFGGQIRGLQSSARLQSSQLQRLGKPGSPQRGTNAPEYFMNYGNYYPQFTH